MPVMDGYEATQQLKADPSTFDIPVIALTASVTVGDKSKVKACGFDGYLSKPVNTQALFNELSRYLTHTKKPPKPVRDAATTGDNSVITPTSDIAKLPELIGKLEKNIMPIWEDINKIMEMEVVEEFAEKVIQLGCDYNVQGFTHYGEHLRDFAQEFDIINIEKTLGEFPEMVKQVQRIGK